MNRFAQSPWRRRLPAKLLCVCGLLCLKAVFAADGPLKNKRLFFDNFSRESFEQEPQSDSVIPDTLDSIEVSMEQPVISESVNRPPVQTRRVGIEFNAVIVGNDRVSVVVNGAPCRAATHLRKHTERTSVPLDCPHITRDDIRLSWIPVQAQLQVNRGDLTMGRLIVGERL